MKLFSEPTRAHETPPVFFVSEKDSDLHAVNQYQIDRVQEKVIKLSTRGRMLLQDAVRCALSVEGRAWKVTPFTRFELACEMKRPRHVLYPHDLALLKLLVDEGWLIAFRQPREAEKVIGADGQELTRGAGWEYVYAFDKRRLIAFMATQPKTKARLELMRGARFSQTL